MAQITISGTSFNVEETAKMTKKEFCDKHRGKVSFDLDNAWIRIEQAAAKLRKEDEEKPLRKKKKSE